MVLVTIDASSVLVIFAHVVDVPPIAAKIGRWKIVDLITLYSYSTTYRVSQQTLDGFLLNAFCV